MNLKNTFFGVGGTHSQTNIFGISPEILAAIVKQHGEHSDLQKKEIDRLQSALELTTGQIRAALEILGEANIPSEGIAAKLVEIAGRFKILQAMVSTDPTDSPKIIELKIEAQRAIGSGKLARADELWAQIETEQRISFDRVAANIAETLAKRGEIAMTRLRYTEAAGHFANAAAILPIGDPHEGMRAGFLELESGAWYIHGYEFGDIVALRLAIERQRHLITLLSRKRVPLDWAKAQNAVGIALSRLGEHENETTSLDAAAAAYREALKERTRVRVPLDWAMTQNNLGNVLSKLGERKSSTARLDEAVAAFREALKELTRKRDPLGWAMTQNNLGTTLLTLGERESGIGRLNAAVAAYREALKELTQERRPLQWAGIQMNLGNALSKLGERESGTAHLDEAVSAYREALKKWPQERVPLDWAMAQSNLGGALFILGTRESGTARLKEAVATYRLALGEFTRERVRLRWATTQLNLGSATLIARRAREQIGASRRGDYRLSRGVEGIDAGPCASAMGNGAEQSRQRPPQAWGARERYGTSRRGDCLLLRSDEGMDF